MFDIVWCIDVILTQRPLSCVCIQISNRVFRVTQKTCSLNWHFEIVLIMIKFEQCAAACSCRCVINFIKVYSLFCLHYKCQYLWFRRLRPTHTQTTEKTYDLDGYTTSQYISIIRLFDIPPFAHRSQDSPCFEYANYKVGRVHKLISRDSNENEFQLIPAVFVISILRVQSWCLVL